MKTKITVTFMVAALAGGLLSSCYVAQPAFECSPQASSYYAKYELVSGQGGACTMYTGDLIRPQRYLAPGAKIPTMALLARRTAVATRVVHGDVRTEFVRYDIGDTNKTYPTESAIGPLTSLEADNDGICTATLAPSDMNLPMATRRRVATTLPDGGSGFTDRVLPATRIIYDWKKFRFLNTARFPATIADGEVDITVDACTAKYKVQAIWPPHGCETDEDCSPNANLDAGRIAGSGLNGDYNPTCFIDAYAGGLLGHDGVCVPNKTLDQLKELN